MEINICRRNKYGYCKHGDNCHFRHENIICIDNNCNIYSCEKRHPKICSWYQQYGRCKFTSFCKFKHENKENIDELIKRIEENANKLNEINASLQAIEKEEKTAKNQIEVFEKQLAGRCEVLESKLNVALETIEKKTTRK